MMSKVSPQATPTDDDKTQWIPSNMAHPWDVAVVYNSLDMESCGHRIRWQQIPPLTCPICEANIVLVGDPIEDINKKVLFKYNKQIFRLSIQHSKRSWWERIDCTAQDRIAYALGMNVKRGMKVLYKGKVLHPDAKRTPMDVSHELLDISERDWEHRKASLVVMGTREGQGLHEPREGLFYAILGFGIAIVLRMMRMVWGTVLLLYSYVKPLPPPSDEQRRDD